LFTSIKNAIFKHGYLIITAAWLYTISFIFSNYFSYNSGPEKVKQNLARSIHDEEQVFDQLINDTTSLSNLIFYSSNTKIKQTIQNGKSKIFIYKQLTQSKIKKLY